MSTQIDAIHLVDEDIYLCEQLPWCTGSFFVDGLPVKPPFAFHKDSVVEKVVKQLPPIIRYLSRNGEATLEVEEHQLQFDYWNELKNEDGEFSSLEDEYRYKKFLAEWSPVYGEPAVVHFPVEVRLTEIRTNSGSPDIHSLWNSPLLRDKREQGLYYVNSDSFLKSYLTSKAAQESLALEHASHTGIRYAKIEGDYSFNDSSFFNERKYIGTLDQCRKHIESLCSIVEDAIALALAKKHNKKLLNAGQVVEALVKIRSGIQAIVPSAKSKANWQATTRELDTVIANIRNNL